MARIPPVRQLFIDGEWKVPVLGKRIPIISPASEDVIGSIPAATKSDVENAIIAARSAFYGTNGKSAWSKTSGSFRAGFLRAIAEKIKERKQELAEFESLDMGKPLDESLWDMDDVAGCFEYYADLACELDRQQNQIIEVPMDVFQTTIRKEPLGVVGLITPWNYPFLMAAWKVAPALAAGCTAVLKPSEMASITCLELGAICMAVGLPAGVLNIVTGLGADAGAPLSAHPLIDKVAFTGSTETGRRVMRSAAENLTPVTLELGGKSPAIVFDDVDLDAAVEWAMFGCFWTNGQICSATSRLLVQDTVYPAFKARLTEWVQGVKVSDPLEPGCRMGPIVSKEQYEKVLGFIEGAVSKGAKIITGGGRPQGILRGYFILPTALEVSPSMRVWSEEVFGPVLSVLPFSTEEEAVQLANNTEYGLAAAVLSADEARCTRVAEAMECGVVWVNCSQPCFVQAPWGGKKRSGIGRELGPWGLENYLSVKQVTKYLSKDQWKWYTAPSKL